jgi:hypothetical protein
MRATRSSKVAVRLADAWTAGRKTQRPVIVVTGTGVLRGRDSAN